MRPALPSGSPGPAPRPSDERDVQVALGNLVESSGSSIPGDERSGSSLRAIGWNGFSNGLNCTVSISLPWERYTARSITFFSSRTLRATDRQAGGT